MSIPKREYQHFGHFWLNTPWKPSHFFLQDQLLHHMWHFAYIKRILLKIKISLICYKHHWYFIIRVTSSFFYPFTNVVKRLSIGNIIDQNNSNRSSVIRSCNGFESFLSCLNKLIFTVSHICNLMCLSLVVISLDPNSTPIVVSWSNLNFFYKNWRRTQDFPTPLLFDVYLYLQLWYTWKDKRMSSSVFRINCYIISF